MGVGVGVGVMVVCVGGGGQKYIWARKSEDTYLAMHGENILCIISN